MTSSTDFRPAKHSDFSQGEGLIQDRLPIVKKGLLEGRADDPNNIVILVGPTEEKFVVNKSLAKLSSRCLEKAIEEASESNASIKLPEILPKHFQTVLEWAIAEMEWTITNLQEACRLIETADQFGFYDLIGIICESVFHEAEIREELFEDKESLEMIVFQSLKFESVRQIALDYILEHASSIFPGNNFLRLSLEELGEILIQDTLEIESEVELLNAVIRWGINALKNETKLASPENLRDVLAEPLNWIRFPNMDEREFRDYVIPMQILTDQQISSMECWYKNGSSISAFNCHARNYVKAMDAKPVGNDPNNINEFLHATKMDNLLAKFNMNIQIHDSYTEAHHWKIQARKLMNEKAELETQFQRVEALLGNWQKIMEVNRFCQRIEAFKKYYESSSQNKAGNQNNDLYVLKLVAEKIHKMEDFGQIFANIDERESIDVELLESVNKAIRANIVKLQRIKCSDFSEYLAWKIFQKETESTVTKLQKFENTEKFACAIVLRNNTSKPLRNLHTYKQGSNRLYIALPNNILPFRTHNYGQTGRSEIYGVLSYNIGATKIFVEHWFDHWSTFGIGMAPSTFTVSNDEEFVAFECQDWTNDSTKIKTLSQTHRELEKFIKLGNLCLHAELIGTAPKAVLRVLLTECDL